MSKSFIEWILIISGLITAGSGVVALLFFLIFNYDQRTKSNIPRASRCSLSGTGECWSLS